MQTGEFDRDSFETQEENEKSIDIENKEPVSFYLNNEEYVRFHCQNCGEKLEFIKEQFDSDDISCPYCYAKIELKS